MTNCALCSAKTERPFNDGERLVIELADAMTDTPANVSDDLYARLQTQFSEEQLMQLDAQIAFENYRARWNRIFNVESDNLYAPQPNNSQESRPVCVRAASCVLRCISTVQFGNSDILPPVPSGFAGAYAFKYLRAETRSFVSGFVVLRFYALAAGIIGSGARSQSVNRANPWRPNPGSF